MQQVQQKRRILLRQVQLSRRQRYSTCERVLPTSSRAFWTATPRQCWNDSVCQPLPPQNCSSACEQIFPEVGPCDPR